MLPVKVNGSYTNADNTPLGTADLKADVLRGNVPAVWKYMPLVVGQRHNHLAAVRPF